MHPSPQTAAPPLPAAGAAANDRSRGHCRGGRTGLSHAPLAGAGDERRLTSNPNGTLWRIVSGSGRAWAFLR